MGLDSRHHRYSSGSDSLQSTNSFTSFINVINLIFLLGEIQTFFTLGPIFGPKKHNRKITASILTPFSELLPNLYYSPIKKLDIRKNWLIKAFSNEIYLKSNIFTLMTWSLFVLINQAKYYAQNIFLLGEIKSFFNPKDSSYLYLLPSLLVNFFTNYLELCNIVTFLF
jgi:hypothetical protein